ncbi:hypothetical protein MUU49_06260 [Scandinavium goeteborgense]|uniref:DUF6933 domain-containing protein n=1 Tax=Scandinavium goeteborgense TaxID=1851514 RepID=UPI00216527BC|nr:hypothetical protein [Scandinavium goeteborgense]MCS2152184.1 hypothetical protein [Scandinavium goeteborgense]
MMVINCSSAAALHLYGKYKKGHDEGFFEPTASVRETLIERQERLTPQGIMQWVVHAVKMGRSTSLIAMEFSTRWVHVIHQVRKGDVNGFVERLNGRLINGIEWLGTDFSLFTREQMDAAIDYFFAQHRELRFYQQTDRSTMTHINQVSAIYQDTLHSTGAFPGDEEIALEFDLRLNRDWRCRKGEPFDLQVDEKMLLSWMTQYSGNTYSEAEQALAQIKDVRRTMLMGGTELHDMPQTASEQGGNVILIDDYIKGNKRR